MAFGNCGGGGRRCDRRVHTPQPALLVTLADRHRALLFDISRSGAMLKAEKTPKEGRELFLQVGDLEVYARVVWKQGDLCGLKFEQRIREWEVSRLDWNARAGIKATLRPSERGGADDWVTGVAR